MSAKNYSNQDRFGGGWDRYLSDFIYKTLVLAFCTRLVLSFGELQKASLAEVPVPKVKMCLFFSNTGQSREQFIV